MPSAAAKSTPAKTGRRQSDYGSMFRATPGERIRLIREGVPAQSLVEIGEDMGISKEQLYLTLHFPRATINRKIAQKAALPPEYSERTLGLQKLIGQVEVMVRESGGPDNFSAAKWLADWLKQPLPALGGERPGDYMDTIEGQELVASLIARMQSGAYS